jgi:hypothetical protein
MITQDGLMFCDACHYEIYATDTSVWWRGHHLHDSCSENDILKDKLLKQEV